MTIADNLVLISHRGITGRASENTYRAFKDAVDHGFRYLETDLRITADGQIILSHDESTLRLSGQPWTIRDRTRAELETLKLTKNDHFMFFNEFIREFAGYHWTFDIKPEHGFATISALRDWATENKAFDWLISQARFVMWTGAQQKFLEKIFPGAVVYAQKYECWRAGLSALFTNDFFRQVKFGKIFAIQAKILGVPMYRSQVVDRYHAAGAQVIAFLPSSDKELRDAAEAGCDEIIMNGKMPNWLKSQFSLLP